MRSIKIMKILNGLTFAFFFLAISAFSQNISYKIVDTGQEKCYDNNKEITQPSKGEAFYGQDAHFQGHQSYTDNGDGTVTDNITGLMWTKDDSGESLNWEEALGFVQKKNEENYLGYNDWSLPNLKELQSIVDYSRSPSATNSPAIDPIFNCTLITDEGGGKDWPFYWSSTTHVNANEQVSGSSAMYVAFGKALGFMEMPPNSGSKSLMDVHGAGAQRSDPKAGNPDDYPDGFGPQGDVIRIYNYVRMVRDIGSTSGIEEQGRLEEKIKIFPNPASEYIEISLDRWTPSGRWSPSEIKIYNSFVKCIMSVVVGAIHELPLQRIYISHLPNGLYFIQIGNYSQKFVIKKHF